MWPNFRSPLMWDVFAVCTYVDRLAAVLVRGPGPRPRDAARPRHAPRVAQIVLRHSSPRLARLGRALAALRAGLPDPRGLSTPLVLSVHSVVSFDFATSRAAGLAHDDLPAVLRRRRHLLRLRDGAHADGDRPRGRSACEHLITIKHLENMNKIILADRHDRRLRLRDGVLHRLVQRQPLRALRVHEPRLRAVLRGPTGSMVTLQRHHRRSSSGSRRCARNVPVMFVISIFVNIGMWFERFVIIVTSLHRDFLPSSWGYFQPDLGRHPDLRRHLRPVLHAVPAVHPLPADDRDRGSEGRDGQR